MLGCCCRNGGVVVHQASLSRSCENLRWRPVRRVGSNQFFVKNFVVVLTHKLQRDQTDVCIVAIDKSLG